VPVPEAANLDELNLLLLSAVRADETRRAGERELSVGAGLEHERAHLLPLPTEGFELAEDSFATVDAKGCVRARTNWYSTPLRARAQCRVRVLPTSVEVWHDGRCVARHERNFLRRQQVFDLEHAFKMSISLRFSKSSLSMITALRSKA
jgi:hypothetical protein